MKRFILLITLLSGLGLAAELSLPAVFSDHMVLQRERPVPVWGKADPGSAVTVEFAGQKKTTTAAADRKWRVDLDPMPASSESRLLKVASSLKSEIINLQFTDVLIGEVWLCSGQSNMQRPMAITENAGAAIATANDPQIRLFNTPRVPSVEPRETIDAQWEVCTPGTVTNFSGVAYYFGRKLRQDLNVPVGLLLSAWGGTRIEPWTPPCGFASVDALKDVYERTQSPGFQLDNPKPHQTPTALYNGMLHAHIPFAIRGAIWYQGESNVTDGMLYLEKSKALINGWRQLWGYDFPFYFVQIAPFGYPEDKTDILPRFWEAESDIVKTIPKTGMAVVSDFTTLHGIHPPNKEVPGARLALLAEANDYGMKVVSTGPVFQTLEKQGSKLKILFSSAAGLATRDGKAPDWFEIAGKDGVFKKADTAIEGNAVIAQSSEVPDPEAVRFAWNKLAVPNLINGAGLPAPAFRAGGLSNP